MTAKLAFFALLVVALSGCGSHAYKTQPVDLHDIELEVPAAWKLGQGSCGTPTANTVLWNIGVMHLCQQLQPPNVSAVIFQAYPPQADPKYASEKTIGGVRVYRSTQSQGRYVQLDLPGRGIGVTVFSPDATLVRQIVSSLHTARRDKNGCPTHSPTNGYRLGSRPKADERFIPPGAIKLIGCYYNGRWLDHSVRVGRDRAQQVTRVMNNAHYGLSGMPRGRIAGRWCRPSFGKFSVGHFEYANRPPVAVTVHPNGCARLGASNGTWAVRMSHAWVPTFWRNVTYDGSIANGWDS